MSIYSASFLIASHFVHLYFHRRLRARLTLYVNFLLTAGEKNVISANRGENTYSRCFAGKIETIHFFWLTIIRGAKNIERAGDWNLLLAVQANR